MRMETNGTLAGMRQVLNRLTETEMGDRLAIIDMDRKLTGAVPLSWSESWVPI